MGGGDIGLPEASGSVVPDDEKVITRDIESRAIFRPSVANDDVHLGVALHETGNVSAGLSDHFNTRETL